MDEIAGGDAETGAEVEASAAAAKNAGVRYVHLPMNGAKPDPAVADTFPASDPTTEQAPGGDHASEGAVPVAAATIPESSLAIASTPLAMLCITRGRNSSPGW